MIPPVRGEITLPHHERGAELRHLRVVGNGPVDGGAMHEGRDIATAGGDVAQAAVLVGDQVNLAGQRDERSSVRSGHAAVQGQPGHGPIQEPGVAEAVAQPARGLGADGALAAGAGAVQGHGQTGRDVRGR